MAITTQMRTDVSQLYVALFGRAPDGEGLGYWVQQRDAGQSMTQIADTMYATTPARAYYPSFMTNGEIIDSFYVNVLGRTADAEGAAYWTAKLNAPGATPGSVIAELINVVANYGGTDPAGLTSQALFNNKVSVAQWYGEQNGTIAGATTILTGVTDDPATVTAAESGSVASGLSFTLTTGQDNILGTAGNDTINGLIDGVANTFTLGDTINGGNGTGDTLKLTTDQAVVDLGMATISGIEKVVVDSRSTTLDTVDLKDAAGAYQSLVVDGNNFDPSNFSILNAGPNTAMTLKNMTGGSSVDVYLNEQAAGINGSMTLKNVDAAVWVYPDSSLNGSAANDVYTVTLDGVSNASGNSEFYVTDVETFNVVVAGNSALQNIGDYYNDNGSLMGNTTVNLTANANLSVQFWDMNDDSGTTENTTFNITGAGNVTIADLDDGSSNLTIAAGTATGNISIMDIDSEAVSVTTGSGNDTIEISNSATAVTLGAGDDKVIVGTNIDDDSVLHGGGGSTDTLSLDAATAVVGTTTLLAKLGTVFDGFEKIELSGALNGALDMANLDNIQSLVLAGGVGGASTVTGLASGATIENKGWGGGNVLTVSVTDAATGTADVLNLKLNAGASGWTSVTAAGVETLNINSTTTDTDPTNVDNDLHLSATAHTTINVTGDTYLTLDHVALTSVKTVSAGSFDAGLGLDLTGNANEVTVTTGAGDDYIIGGTKADVINAGNGDNYIEGADGNDSITTGTGDDAIYGGAGNDTIKAGNGVNTISGNAGLDTMTGGTGIDTYVFAAVGDSQGVTVDVITNFTGGALGDVLDFSAITVGIGAYLGAANGYGAVLTSFTAGATAEAVLDTSTNTLYVDVDGSGTLDNNDMAIQLTGVTALTDAANFVW